MLSCRIRFQFNIHSGPHLWKINIPCCSGAMAHPPHSPDRGDDRQAGPQVQHRRRAAGTPILHFLTHHHHLTHGLLSGPYFKMGAGDTKNLDFFSSIGAFATKSFARSKIFRYGLPQDILSKAPPLPHGGEG